MKSKIRALSLIMSFILLLTTAAPAFAAEYNAFYDQLANPSDYPDGETPLYSISFDSNRGNYKYEFDLVYAADRSIFRSYIDEIFLNPNVPEETTMDGWVEAGTITWESDGWFNPDFSSDIESIIDIYLLGIAEEVSNREHYYSFDVSDKQYKDFYTVVLTCLHYQVTTSVFNRYSPNSGSLYGVTLEYAPYIGGDYIYLDCPDLP